MTYRANFPPISVSPLIIPSAVFHKRITNRPFRAGSTIHMTSARLPSVAASGRPTSNSRTPRSRLIITLASAARSTISAGMSRRSITAIPAPPAASTMISSKLRRPSAMTSASPRSVLASTIHLIISVAAAMPSITAAASISRSANISH